MATKINTTRNGAVRIRSSGGHRNLIRQTEPIAPTKKESSADACGCAELEGLCRPRFFDGQLLTEEDLNRLERYMVEKNRLHNRHLHGWGVVCGLEVVCDPCGEGVTVRSGYALSPCGDDIVVPRDETVAICDLIQQCHQDENHALSCEPPRYGTNGECSDAVEEWLLSVRYEESPSRGLAALRPQAGGHCAGTGGAGAARTARCEPTVICEGYRFEVSRFHDGKAQAGSAAMAERFQACAQPFLDYVYWFADRLDGWENMSPEQLQTLCCELKEALIDLLQNHHTDRCDLIERVAHIACPDSTRTATTRNSFEATLGEAVKTTLWAWYTALIDCLCSVLLPPCTPGEDPRVVLAKVSVRKRDCKVLRICNWTTQRKFATTAANLQYWLSIIPLGRSLRQAMEQVCCGDWFSRLFGLETAAAGGEFTTYKKANTIGELHRFTLKESGRESREFAKLSLDALSGRLAALEPKTLFKGLAGLSDEQDRPLLDDFQRANPLSTLLAGAIGPSLLSGVLPEDWSSTLSSAVAGAVPAEAAKVDVQSLDDKVKAMEKTVKAQEKLIKELKKRLDERG